MKKQRVIEILDAFIETRSGITDPILTQLIDSLRAETDELEILKATMTYSSDHSNSDLVKKLCDQISLSLLNSRAVDIFFKFKIQIASQLNNSSALTSKTLADLQKNDIRENAPLEILARAVKNLFDNNLLNEDTYLALADHSLPEAFAKTIIGLMGHHGLNLDMNLAILSKNKYIWAHPEISYFIFHSLDHVDNTINQSKMNALYAMLDRNITSGSINPAPIIAEIISLLRTLPMPSPAP